jgi:hypothetical protein
MPSRTNISRKAKRAKALAAGAGLGALALGGILARKRRSRGGDEPGATADPIAETPSAPPGAEAKEVPEPERAEAPQAEDKAASEEKAASEASEKATAEDGEKTGPDEKPAAAKRTIPVPHPEPPITTGTDAPPNPAVEPGNISRDDEPHHALNNPVRDPDETEYPDPFDKREDPRDPVDPDGAPFGEEPHSPTGALSTSEPPPALDPEGGDRAEPPRRENLDD